MTTDQILHEERGNQRAVEFRIAAAKAKGKGKGKGWYFSDTNGDQQLLHVVISKMVKPNMWILAFLGAIFNYLWVIWGLSEAIWGIVGVPPGRLEALPWAVLVPYWNNFGGSWVLLDFVKAVYDHIYELLR